jgi:ribose-phosphate pyrophosphokinase
MEHQIKILEPMRGKHVFYIHSMNDPLHDNIMEMLLTVSAIRRCSAAKITVVVPYFAYARDSR